MTNVTLTKLTKRFGGTVALDAISLSIESGSFISLLGPSGCGKSTTLRLVAGFEQCDSGHIFFDDLDISPLPPERRDIGMVFQSYALFPHMTVGQNLAFGLEMRRIGRPEIRRRVARALEMVRLDAHEDRYPRQLSGGQQQRVALARALVIEPRILLLDEPLANLDATLRDEMRIFIRDLQQRVGITTLYVTHDQSEAMAMSDQVVVMAAGRILQAGPPSELYERPAGSEVAGFIGRANLLAAGITARAGGLWAMTALGERPLHAQAVAGEGDGHQVLVRPEALVLVAVDAPGAVPGEILSAQYGGNLSDYRVALAGGETLLVQAAGPIRCAAGERVGVRLDDGALWALPRQSQVLS